MERTHQKQTQPSLGRTDGWPPLHETDPIAQTNPSDDQDAPVNETGTTIVALRTDDAVILAADRRASLGGRFITNKSVQKIEDVHPTAALALSGSVGHIQQFSRMLRAEAALYEQRREDRMNLEALSTLAGNVLGGSPLHVSPLLGGVDDSGPHVIQLDMGGGVLSDDYAAGGSGMQLAYGVLERTYESGLSSDEAQSLAARAIDGASERDTASGDGLTIAVVTAEGIDVDEYETVGEVS